MAVVTRFAFVSAMTSHYWGGSEELWAGSAVSLASDGEDVHASVNYWPKRATRLAELQQAGVQIAFRNNSQRTSFINRALTKIKRAVIRKNESEFERWLTNISPSLVCVSNGNFKDGLTIMEALVFRGVPFVSIVQANAEFLWPDDREAERLRLVYNHALSVCCVSIANRDLLERQLAIRLANARLVHNPVNVSRSSPPPWRKFDGVFRLAYVARLEPESKGQDLLFEVLSHSKWKHRNISVSLIGSGTSSEGIRRLVNMYGIESQVELKGQVADIGQVWSEHDALVLFSRYEGLPLSIVEAMLCGRPCIVTDIAGNCEVVEDDVTGFVAAFPNVNAIDEAMERAWQNRNRWQEMGLAARRVILTKLPLDPCREFGNYLRSMVEHL